MKGRKPKPAAMRILQGKAAHRPIKDSVTFPVETLPPPDFLKGHALEEWNRMEPVLRGIGILTVADSGALAAYCSAWGDMLDAEKAISELPRGDRIVGKGTDGRITRNLISRARDEYRRDMIKFASELGITPSARTKVTPVAKPDKPNKFTDLIAARKRSE